jgi:hypothetical protein
MKAPHRSPRSTPDAAEITPVKASTMSLFEREMHEQVSAAQEAVQLAMRHNDPLLVQAATSHLEGLLDLARRNGIAPVEPQAASAQ